MRLWRGVLLLVLSLGLLAGCSMNYDPQVDIAALDSKIARFAEMVTAENVDGIMEQYSSDVEPEAYMIYGNMRGSDQIRAGWERLFAEIDVKNLEITEQHHKLDRNMAVSYGMWRMTIQRGEMEMPIEGRFSNVMGRNAGDGHWQLLAVHLSVPLPAMAPPPPPEA